MDVLVVVLGCRRQQCGALGIREIDDAAIFFFEPEDLRRMRMIGVDVEGTFTDLVYVDTDRLDANIPCCPCSNPNDPE